MATKKKKKRKPASRKKTARKRVAKHAKKRAKKKPVKRARKKAVQRRTVKRKKKRPVRRKKASAKRKVGRKVRRKTARKPARKATRKKARKTTRKKARKRPKTVARKKKKPVRRTTRVTARKRRPAKRRPARRKKPVRRFPKAPAAAARKPRQGFSLRKLAARLTPTIKPPIEAYSGNKPYVFASYSHKNIKEVFWCIKKLAESRYRIWYDEGIEPGNEWPEEVGRALTGCQLFLVFMSPEAMDSRNVRNEINFASSEGKSMMVVVLQPAGLSEGMQLQIGTVQTVNKHEMTDIEFLEKIKKVLDPGLRL